jgi:selenocysteine-specific translation elongation factor
VRCWLEAFATTIVGTAGRIDHGKTTLVKALTGVGNHRLPEARKRGGPAQAHMRVLKEADPQ